jgi:DNA-binding CsgD family transcriptional regulator
MRRNNYILIGSDTSNGLTEIINSVTGIENYTCITAVKSSDTLQLIRSLQPNLIILHFREVQGILNNLKTFTDLKEINLLCLTHKFHKIELVYTPETSLFVQSYDDALRNNNLRNNVNFLLKTIQKARPNKDHNMAQKKPISDSYKNYNHNLARYTIELDQKRAMLNKVKQKIKQLCIQADINTKSKLVSLLNTIKISSRDKGHWEDFKMYFEDINPHFLKTLSNKYPKLTSKDLKYCCYLKMNMSNEDICNIFGINQESVRTHKYRLKIKMTLSKEQNLRNFLHAF